MQQFHASRFVCLGLLAAVPFLGLGCSSGDEEDVDLLTNEKVGESQQPLTKPTGHNGDDDYCDNAANKCGIGEGDCDLHTQCAQTGFTLRCGLDNGAKWGMPPTFDVCIPTHCVNGIRDGAETSIDCGDGCGTQGPCSPTPVCTGALGGDDYCTTCLCQAGQGDCDTNTECATGLVCGVDNGGKYGLASSTDLCVPAHCKNGVKDAAETSIDCGDGCGNLGPCNAAAVCTGSPGGEDYCTTCACASGQGDCDANSECAAGLICGTDNGPKFHYAIGTDVCVPSHCVNGVADGDETELDCGGSCGACSSATHLATGSAHACLVSGGNVLCWGDNSASQLGDGTTVDAIAPVTVPGITGATRVGAGRSHSCAIVAGGAVKCWGRGAEGQLGNGSQANSATPVNVATVTGATELALGDNFSCALAGGTAYCWGDNTSGQTGKGTIGGVQTTPFAATTAVTALAAGGRHACVVKSTGAVWCWGEGTGFQLGNDDKNTRGTPAVVNGITGASDITAGDQHTCAVAGGSVYCWGLNASSMLGTGEVTAAVHVPTVVPGLSGITKVASGWRHTCAVGASGTVQCWGRGDFGQLGAGNTKNTVAPVSVLNLSGATLLDGGEGFTCTRTPGSVRCWGYNLDGQLGRGTSPYRLTPSTISMSAPAMMSGLDTNTCAATAAGAVTCWGSNDGQQIGDNTDRQRRSPTAVAGLSSTFVTTGGGHTCAITAGGGVSCWGSNVYGQLGDGTTTDHGTPVAIPGLTGVVELAAGVVHTCARTSAGAVRCWGRNQYGEVGDGTTVQKNSPVTAVASGATALITGQRHTCAIVSGVVRCWGRNFNGQLGDGTTADKSTPTAVVGSPANPAELAAGQRHTCVRTTANVMQCWGDNANGQLGDGTTTAHLTPGAVSIGAVSDISAGGAFTCAILISTGKAMCWGWNSVGQVGDGTTVSRSTPTVALGSGTITAIWSGSAHSCARTSSNTIRCWGDNSYGQIGDRTSVRNPEGDTVLF